MGTINLNQRTADHSFDQTTLDLYHERKKSVLKRSSTILDLRMVCVRKYNK